MPKPPLTDAEIAAVIEDRFGRWGGFLRGQRATPLLVVGLDIEEGRAFVTVPEGVPTGTVIQLLEGALKLARRGEITNR
jgi:hypothetical protein